MGPILPFDQELFFTIGLRLVVTVVVRIGIAEFVDVVDRRGRTCGFFATETYFQDFLDRLG